MNYLKNTYFFNFNHPSVSDFAITQTIEATTDKEKAVCLFYAVRDGWRYEATHLYFQKEKWRTSEILQRDSAHCLDKANILIASLRAVQIPARLHLVKVKNHIAAERVIEKFKTDELTPHAYVEVFLAGKWVAATPAFNKGLCEKLNVEPLEWDGRSDAIFQQYSRSGHQFMEYLADYGTFDDLPLDFIYDNLLAHYPALAAHFGRR